MCRNCNNNILEPEFEALFHNEFEYETMPESEFSGIYNTVKSYASPVFNWLSQYVPGGSAATPAPTVTPPVASPGRAPATEQQFVQSLIATGNRDENSLTNKVFYRRHPELNGQPLSSSQPNFSSLSKEWISIRDGIVRPALRSPGSTNPGVAPSTGPVPSGKLNLASIMDAMMRKKYVIYQEPFKLNIVGVRANNATPNSFDDSINVFYKDGNGIWQFKSNPATTDPGSHYLQNPMNSGGTAIVLPGQYINSHKIGLHRGEYTALVQQGTMKIVRDTNKDNRLDFRAGKEINGTYGLNIHRATSNGTSKVVDRYSAGCQVFANSSDFANFISLCQQHSAKHGNNFTYTLLEETDL
jgi:hypothetical protein